MLGGCLSDIIACELCLQDRRCEAEARDACPQTVRSHRDLRGSPIANGAVGVLYRRAEATVSLVDRFEAHSREDGAFRFRACRRMLAPIC